MSTTGHHSESPKKRHADTDNDPSKRPKTDHHHHSKNPDFKKHDNSKDTKSQSRKERWRQKDAKFHYGNYDRYYGKRAVSTGQAKDVIDGDAKASDFDDPRLKHFKVEWFDSKKVLDIGCNVGFMTMAIAHRYGPSSIAGLDIDGSLIRTAKNILRKNFGPADSGDIGKDGKKKEKQGGSSRDDMDDMTEREKANVFKRVRFETGNYVLSDDSLLDCVRPEYDVILALSLTKWIHLNWGDDGMKRFFRRIYRHLYPGGILLLEPQPWSTYKKRKGMTPEIAHNYNNIHFKPDRFRPFLLSEEVGFESCEVINKIECEGKGFHRPIYLFRKPVVEGASANKTASKETGDNGETSKVEESGDGGSESADKVVSKEGVDGNGELSKGEEPGDSKSAPEKEAKDDDESVSKDT